MACQVASYCLVISAQTVQRWMWQTLDDLSKLLFLPLEALALQSVAQSYCSNAAVLQHRLAASHVGRTETPEVQLSRKPTVLCVALTVLEVVERQATLGLQVNCEPSCLLAAVTP